MKSGQGFHETCQAVIVKEFRRELVAKKKKSVAEADQMIPPPYWEYRHSPWMFLLCVKILRKNIHLAPNVAEVLNEIVNTVDSRAAIKRKAQNAHFKKTGDNNHKVLVKIKNEFGGGSSTLVRHGQESATRAQKHHAWAQVHLAKALEENANVGRKMAEMDAFEKHLSFLERTRDDLGEEDYKARVKALVLDMPTTKNFSKNCEVICISDDDTAADHEYGKKRKAVIKIKKEEIWSGDEEESTNRSSNHSTQQHDSDADQENDVDL